MHHYKRHIGDYQKKAGRLSLLQHGVYNQLIDSCYDRERFPVSEDEAIDWVWASTLEEIEAVRFVLKKFFTFENGAFIQQRIKDELEEFFAFCAEQARKGKNGGRPKKKPAGLGENPKKAGGFSEEPDGKPKPIKKNPNPITHEPSNPVTQCNTESTEADSAGKNKKFNPPSFDELTNYFLERGCIDSSQPQRFLDFYDSKGWMVGKNKMKNWQAAVRNWLNNSRGGFSNANSQNNYRESTAERVYRQAADVYSELENDSFDHGTMGENDPTLREQVDVRKGIDQKT